MIRSLYRFALCLTVVVPATALAQKPPAPFTDCKGCPEMVTVPAGSFVMGSDGPHEFERPAHKVTVAKSFAIGRFEITFDQWAACVADKGCTVEPDDHKWGRGKRPVINVTFADVNTYVAWLARRSGKPYRLPSDAEWEYAARAGTTTEFWWGDDVGKNMANCRDCGSEWSAKGSGPVGSFKPNPWGLYDTAGNVWEWVADCWNPSHEGAPADTAPRLTGNCNDRVMRGGSWYYFSKNSRSAWRFRNDARVQSYGIGFRVARDLP